MTLKNVLQICDAKEDGTTARHGCDEIDVTTFDKDDDGGISGENADVLVKPPLSKDVVVYWLERLASGDDDDEWTLENISSYEPTSAAADIRRAAL